MSADRGPAVAFDRTAEAAAAAVISRYSTSFGLATRLLRGIVRTRTRSVYALVRVADEIVDGAAAGHGIAPAPIAEALEETGLVQQALADPRVLVTCTGERGLWIAATGRARIHDDRALMSEHWDPDIERWFDQGVDTPGLRLLEVVGEHVRYWTYDDGEGEIDLSAADPGE